MIINPNSKKDKDIVHIKVQKQSNKKKKNWSEKFIVFSKNDYLFSENDKINELIYFKASKKQLKDVKDLS